MCYRLPRYLSSIHEPFRVELDTLSFEAVFDEKLPGYLAKTFIARQKHDLPLEKLNILQPITTDIRSSD